MRTEYSSDTDVERGLAKCCIAKVCAALLKNLRGCFDFAILCHAQPMVSIFHPALAADMLPELQVAEGDIARVLEIRLCAGKYREVACAGMCAAVVVGAGASELEQPKLFLELVNAL
ncbi:hypothetical protein AK812_SmicGene11741 [Symbiodinium microadriaticum]|uniref:Uncharacterized protein n=1 Tax=Symbiodinium microadriaticum TaxID=2951 RepID=A0A1Q9ECH5_SYMMI|nr:hypothetical protein AK812_SmicGene11741 [Symbiodinium microadriaticum]